jgi:carbon storage regulator CsrA
MLVLTRKSQQQIKIGDNIVITIIRVKGNSVRVGIDAPRSVRVVRSELPELPNTVTQEEAPVLAKPLSDEKRASHGAIASGAQSLGGVWPVESPQTTPAADQLASRRRGPGRLSSLHYGVDGNRMSEGHGSSEGLGRAPLASFLARR